jgi:6-phosphogluconolactonase/glucosamine-6-phosphate isomerase/deaminase
MEIRVDDDAAGAAGEWIADRLRASVRRRGTASVALSGGSTAPLMIAALVAAPVPWEAVTVWQVDERIAPDGHDARNAGQLEPFQALPATVRPMPVTAADLRRAARRYADGLPARFDVVHLGIGDDGHTASWPPAEPAVRRSERAVELVASFHGWSRMTLTPPVVNGARARVVLATGAAKRPVVERWLRHEGDLPIGSVRRSRTWVFLDPAAAPDATGHGAR